MVILVPPIPPSICRFSDLTCSVFSTHLQAFKALEKHGYCPDFKGMREWNNAIQKMIDAFELLKYAASYTEDEERRIEQGLDLFRKYYCYLRD